ncbi:hypothetical protein [Trichormus sp. NMC-1]|uniref:hypothetical protein n=1 Tax=Trichormus sp. NMC-1 TaxID=1853259 RepID=UPI0008DC2376|nr:hypothetical protein [Trichormus sp. NMC-1]
MNLIDSIKQALKEVWDFIKRIFVKILNFIRNIRSWFQEPERLKKIEENNSIIAVAIKENLENGNFNVINCLYDQDSDSIIENETLIIETEELDANTKQQFNDKDMIKLT